MAHRVYKIPEFDLSYRYVISEESCAIPDQSLTIQQILNRCANGMPPPDIVQDAQYDEDAEYMFENDVISPEMQQNKDLSDIEDYANEYRRLEESIKANTTRVKNRSHGERSKSEQNQGLPEEDATTP